jgi:hypothetical protein
MQKTQIVAERKNTKTKNERMCMQRSHWLQGTGLVTATITQQQHTTATMQHVGCSNQVFSIHMLIDCV